MSQPVILSDYAGGRHNADLDASISRLDREAVWKDLSTVIMTPAGGMLPTKIVHSWMNLMRPPNNKSHWIFAQGVEVGEAYSQAIEGILAHPDLGKWKYLLCVEHDNAPPSDGMVKLLAQMEARSEFAAIGGLYWTKGEGGQPQIWGDPRDMTLNFRPQRPDPNGGLVECCGTGMGFTVFRLSMFRDSRLRRPWFKTTASREEGSYSQDLYAWSDFRKHGFRCAIDCSVKVGHYDAANDMMW